jgi:polar amino acid transport system substrate-binding protein
MRVPAGVLLLTLSVGAASLTGIAQSTTLNLVSTAWPPFTNPQGQPRFALDLVETALGRIGIGARTAIVDPARYTPALLSNSFDGSAAAWKDAERERALIFSTPYLENRLILLARRGDDVSAATLGALQGKRISIVGGYAYGNALETPGLTLVRASSEEDSLTMLLAGKADYALMDDLVVQYIVDNYPDEARTRLSIGTTPLVTRPLYFAVRRTYPNAESIVSRFNTQLRGLIADRTYHRLLHVAWIRADVDGDGIPEYVPANDRAGASAPGRAYLLYSGNPQAAQAKTGFYVGGNIYSDWASVPNRYKVEDPNRPDPARSTGTIFRFTW